jgi:hypothetical protein
MARSGYIPGKNAEVVEWGNHFVQYIADHSVAWEIPGEEITELQAAQTEFNLWQAVAAGANRTKVIVEKRDTAKKVLEENIRYMVNFRLKNRAVTNADRIAMGLPVRNSVRTPIPDPTTRPVAEMIGNGIRSVQVKFHDEASSTRAKPYGIDGAVILYAVRDTPPKDLADLTHSVLATRTPYTLTFTEAQRGQWVYAALCWQNKKGVKGPCSEIYHCVIQ